jgi:hypothetical protein
MNLEGCNDEVIQRYNELDDIRLRGILFTNQKCRHIKMGQVPFSPALIIARNRIKACQLVRKEVAGGRVSTRYLRRALNRPI